MENFMLYDEIEKANEQVIYKARRKGTIKYLAISCAEKLRRPLISNHVRISTEIKHRNILRFYEWYETSNHLWLVMELCTGGSLEQVMREDRYLSEGVIRKFGADIVQGLKYIHSLGVVFNRMLPSRFLLDGNGTVKLFDFSLAHAKDEILEEVLAPFIEDEEYFHSSFLPELRNVSVYDSPEYITNGVSTHCSDCWGLGVLLYHMYCGCSPFDGNNKNELTGHILYSEPNVVTQGTNGAVKAPSQLFVSLLYSLLTKSASRRIHGNNLVKHPFWQNCIPIETSISNKVDEVGCPDTNLENEPDSNGTPSLPDVGSDSQPNDAVVKEMCATDIQKVITELENANLENASIPIVNIITTDPVNNEAGTFILEDIGNKGIVRKLDEASFTSSSDVEISCKSTRDNSNNNENQSNSCEVNNQLTPYRDIVDSSVPRQKLVKQKSVKQRPKPKDELKQLNSRMVQSEYNLISDPFTEVGEKLSQNMSTLKSDSKLNGEKYSFNTNLLELHSFHSVRVRSKLALVYPWGDDSINFPKNVKLLTDLCCVNYEHHVKMDDKTVMPKYPTHQSLINSMLTGWKPRPSNDYHRWARIKPPTKVENLSRLYNQTLIRSTSVEQLEQHIHEVINLFRAHAMESMECNTVRLVGSAKISATRSAMKNYQTNLLAYLIWLVSATSTSVWKLRSSTSEADNNKLGLIGFALAADLLSEVTRQLRLGNLLPLDVRTGLCRLCSLVTYRTALALIQKTNDQNSFSESLGSELNGNVFSQCLSALIEILREPLARIGYRLRQSALSALGEVLTCVTCLLAYLVRRKSIHEPTTTDIELQSIQWQTAIHHLIRCLSITVSGNASSNSPNADSVPGSLLEAFDFVTPKSNTGDYLAQQRSAGITDDNCDNANANTTKLTEAHVRLSAARSLDNFVTTIIGCQLHDMTCNESFGSCVTSCINSVTTTEIVSRLWTYGLMGSSTNRSQTNSLQQELTLCCANALSGIVRLHPSLFTTGLIDRAGSIAFVALIEPPSMGIACQQTDLVARLLSTAASGLLPPLSNCSKLSATPAATQIKRALTVVNRTSRVQPNSACGSGTPAACRRLLSDQKFMMAVFRHIESPHAMLRAKAFLLSAAILANCPQESLYFACQARLPVLLERSLKATRTLQHHYNDMLGYTTNTPISSSSGPNTDSLSTMYLAQCVTHLADLLVYELIPTVCHHILATICPSINMKTVSGTRSTNTGVSINRKANGRPNSLCINNPSQLVITPNNGSANNNPTITNGTNLNNRSWLTVFNCLPLILTGCGPIRTLLLMQSNRLMEGTLCSHNQEITRSKTPNFITPSTEAISATGFCLLSFIGRLLDHWTSSNTIDLTAGSIAVHQSGSFEQEILITTLTVIEDISQQSVLVQCKHYELVRLILPGLARLAVSPHSRPEIRSICVKIITNLASVLLVESDASESKKSLIELERACSMASVASSEAESTSVRRRTSNQRQSPKPKYLINRPLSADADLLLLPDERTTYSRRQQQRNHNRQMDFSSIPKRMSNSHYPFLDGEQANVNTKSRKHRHSAVITGAHNQIRSRNNDAIIPDRNSENLGTAIQPPSPEILLALFDLVNKLLIRHAKFILTCTQLTAPTAFLRLLFILLNSLPINLCPVKDTCNTPSTQYCPITLIPATPNCDLNIQSNNDEWNIEGPSSAQPNVVHSIFPVHPDGTDILKHRLLDQASQLLRNFSNYGLDVLMVRLLASQLLIASDQNLLDRKYISNGYQSNASNCTNSNSCSNGGNSGQMGSVTSHLCLYIFQLIPQLLNWPDLCKPNYLIIELRLLELLTIACLELGQLIVPEIEVTTKTPSPKRRTHQACNKQHTIEPTTNPRKGSSHLRALHNNTGTTNSHIKLIPPSVHAALLASLTALNSLLNYVADVVKLALNARTNNDPTAEATALAAEELLIAARPNSKLAGLFARLIGLWRPLRPPLLQPDVDQSDLKSWLLIFPSSEQLVIDERDEICFQLCEAAITALTNYASLYGGEYSRSALTPGATDALSFGLLRLIEEDQLIHKDNQVRSDGSHSTLPMKQSTQCHRRVRLLLRIIKRLVFSDPICRARMNSTDRYKANGHLLTTLKYLLAIHQRLADASTCKLLLEIIELLYPTKLVERNALSGDRSSTHSPKKVRSNTASARFGKPTAVA